MRRRRHVTQAALAVVAGASGAGLVRGPLDAVAVGSLPEVIARPVAALAVPAAEAASLYRWPCGSRANIPPGGEFHAPRDNGTRLHDGLDVAVPHRTPVYAAREGTVIQTTGNRPGYGISVTIKHSESVTTFYAHLDSKEISVGRKVNRGTLIGRVGNTGGSYGYHLHFEVHVDGRPRNPRDFLP